MALTAADVELWRVLAEKKAIPEKPAVLEIGQANWYGDILAPKDCDDCDAFVVARKWYKKVLDYESILAVDMHGSDEAVKLDLNRPLWGNIDGPGEFDVVINTGTAEHVFDQRQLMETIHDACKVGGLMIHASPQVGWANHGFYVYQPCFFRDLASANGYELVHGLGWNHGPLPGEPEGTKNIMLYLALRKTRSDPFRVPMQGRYGT